MRPLYPQIKLNIHPLTFPRLRLRGVLPPLAVPLYDQIYRNIHSNVFHDMQEILSNESVRIFLFKPIGVAVKRVEVQR